MIEIITAFVTHKQFLSVAASSGYEKIVVAVVVGVPAGEELNATWNGFELASVGYVAHWINRAVPEVLKAGFLCFKDRVRPLFLKI